MRPRARRPPPQDLTPLHEVLAPRKPPRARLLNYAVITAAIFVAVLLVLIGVGVLRLPNSGGGSSAPVTVLFVHWTILQGKLNNSSQGWFGPFEINYTAPEGYPLNVTQGSTFIVPLVVASFGSPGHWVYDAVAQLPFQVISSSPRLPIFVNTTDDAAFLFTVQAPWQAGATLGLNMTFNALPPSP